ncbi:MAG: 4Fe-4S binding protein [Firmicutes bacterium]|nr:4Fe-4S binding protein [Bacillota bacterium]
MSVRKIVKIDEDKCDGCGLCVTPCAEGAIEIVDGKAKVIREELCDGAGYCLAVCPRGALSIEEREAPAFDEEAVAEHISQAKPAAHEIFCYSCGKSEHEQALLPARIKGESLWVCTRCLPRLIHG